MSEAEGVDEVDQQAMLAVAVRVTELSCVVGVDRIGRPLEHLDRESVRAGLAALASFLDGPTVRPLSGHAGEGAVLEKPNRLHDIVARSPYRRVVAGDDRG